MMKEMYPVTRMMAPLCQMGMLFKIPHTFALHNDMFRDHELDSDFDVCLSSSKNSSLSVNM